MTEIYLHMILEAESVRSRCSKVDFFQGLCPWLMDGHLLPMSSHGLPSVQVRVQIFSFYTDTHCIELEAMPMISFSLDYLFEDPIFKYSHVLRHWVVRISTYEFDGGRNTI